MSETVQNTGGPIVIGQKAISVKVIEKSDQRVCLGVLIPDPERSDDQSRSFATESASAESSQQDF